MTMPYASTSPRRISAGGPRCGEPTPADYTAGRQPLSNVASAHHRTQAGEAAAGMQRYSGRPGRATLPKFMPPRVGDCVEPPRVGDWYMVPSAYRGDLLLPVRLPVHADAGTPHDHVHLDYRFMSARMQRRERQTGLGCIPFAPLIEERPMQCIGTEDHRLGRSVGVTKDGRIVRYVTLEYGTAEIIEGRPRCPHRGADLTDVPVRKGFRRCPLHGMLVACLTDYGG